LAGHTDHPDRHPGWHPDRLSGVERRGCGGVDVREANVCRHEPLGGGRRNWREEYGRRSGQGTPV
jgi:hypothetical protein